MLRKGIFTAIGLLAGTAAICHAQGPLEAADAAVQSFFQKPAKVQKQLLQRMREEAAALDGDYFAAAQAQLAAARKAASARSKLGKTKNSKSPAPQATPAWQLPALVTWRYGLGRIEPVVRVGTSQQRRRDEQRVPVALFALGMLPEADLLVADLQARMDGDRSADAFMRFLELWRNGDESFYEALDRTAGTQDSVFFYDAMLGDFVATFGKGRGDAAKHLASSL
ncbi:MAG: hypothetical protein KAI24_02490, partial [Planctomycetes bacterium]|nr:hypothetical protein [Planctomycetota bacterium]